LAVSCVVVLAAGAAVGVTVWRLTTPSTDSGVKECKLLTSDQSTADPFGTTYKAARNRFSDSRYNDLRTAGTRLMDVIWTSTRGGRVDVSMADSGPFFAAYADLTTACANHGVTLPPLSASTA
jgi:hypothetical protein